MEISGSQIFGTPHSKRSLKANVEPQTLEQGTDSDTLELPTSIQRQQCPKPRLYIMNAPPHSNGLPETSPRATKSPTSRHAPDQWKKQRTRISKSLFLHMIHMFFLMRSAPAFCSPCPKELADTSLASREKKSTTEDHPSLGLYPGKSWAPVGHCGMSTNGMSVSCQVQNGFCMGVACESCILHHCVLYTCNIQYISVHVFTVAALVPTQQVQS